jgi:hypothetical protein
MAEADAQVDHAVPAEIRAHATGRAVHGKEPRVDRREEYPAAA